MSSERVVIVCDERERASGVPQELALLGVVTRFTVLPLGDYIVAPSTAVERKSVRDFISSLYDGRLFRQVNELSRTYTNHVLIVEGDPAEISQIAYNVKSYYGALSSVMLDFNTKTIFTPSPKDTALALDAMARRLTKVRGEKWTTMFQTRPKSHSLSGQQVDVVASLPGIGPNLARRLLSSFGTVRKVFTATSTQLAGVHGVGKARAERIVGLLNFPYREEEKEDTQLNLEQERE
jgi:DNA excision repair protein ERCC-4